jgi:hypothetical protein
MTAAEKLITLEAWVLATYGDPRPSMRTVRGCPKPIILERVR